MSSTRGLVSLVVAATVGVVTGVAIFKPAFKDLQKEKKQKQRFPDFPTSEMEKVDPMSTDSPSSTLATDPPWPIEDRDNFKPDGQSS